ncbi:hypothetical protein RIB2604_02700980 [Aspergillus luchuensis]|uniref:Uncharacterized protein n=1 Tax=Aspergillus kawachii TaxID=1069201 RepID=A0A146FVH7_ASPKA|nr:hypothetical protein RIB2604_02700980 [Aspergillus luchuensis]
MLMHVAGFSSLNTEGETQDRKCRLQRPEGYSSHSQEEITVYDVMSMENTECFSNLFTPLESKLKGYIWHVMLNVIFEIPIVQIFHSEAASFLIPTQYFEKTWMFSYHCINLGIKPHITTVVFFFRRAIWIWNRCLHNGTRRQSLKNSGSSPSQGFAFGNMNHFSWTCFRYLAET